MGVVVVSGGKIRVARAGSGRGADVVVEEAVEGRTGWRVERGVRERAMQRDQERRAREARAWEGVGKGGGGFWVRAVVGGC